MTHIWKITHNGSNFEVRKWYYPYCLVFWAKKSRGMESAAARMSQGNPRMLSSLKILSNARQSPACQTFNSKTSRLPKDVPTSSPHSDFWWYISPPCRDDPPMAPMTPPPASAPPSAISHSRKIKFLGFGIHTRGWLGRTSDHLFDIGIWRFSSSTLASSLWSLWDWNDQLAYLHWSRTRFCGLVSIPFGR